MSSAELLSKINSNTGCILWVTEESINPALKNFSTIDYIIDGLLSSFVEHNPNSNNVTFHTQNFNDVLWIIHLNTNASKSIIDEQFALLKDKLKNKKILILDESKSLFSKEIKTRYSSFSFEEF